MLKSRASRSEAQSSRLPGPSIVGWQAPLLILVALMPRAAVAGVVINEVFYHAPDDVEDLEYIEIHNSSDQAVDLSGWSLAREIELQFAPGTRMEAKAFLVLCRNQDRFREFYDAPVAQVFPRRLSNKGARIELRDASGTLVDAIRYKDSPPWPKGADGHSGSLERICPQADGEDPSNWVSSPLSQNRLKPAGTPGKANSAYSADLPPVISSVVLVPEQPAPGQELTVEAAVEDPRGVAEVNLLYRLAGPGFEKPESSLPMQRVAGSRYTGVVPGQAADQLIRLRIEAVGKTGARRRFPADSEPRPALSTYVHGPIEPAKIPFAWIVQTDEAEFKAAQQRGLRGPDGRGFGPGFPGGGPGFRRQGRDRGPGQGFPGPGFPEPGARPGFPGPGPGPGPGWALAERVLADADKDGDKKLVRDEFSAVAEAWFAKLDPDKAGALNQEEFLESIGDILPAAAGFGPGSAARPRGGQRGGEPERPGAGGDNREFDPRTIAGRGLFAAADADKDGSLTSEEWKETFARWFADWDMDKSGSLDEAKLRAGWSSVVPGPRFAGPRGFGRPDGGFGPGGFGPGRFRAPSRGATSSRSAFLYYDPKVGKLELFDFVEAVPRAGGYKIHFHGDAMLQQMKTINLLFDNERAVLAEPLAYAVYRQAGMAIPESYHVRLWLDGKPMGYHLLVEQVTRAFLRRHELRDDGHLYKLLWYESGVVGQHEKKTRTREGHDDIVALVRALEEKRGDELWELIKANFDVAEVANYFAVCMVISNWDGFFNNYLTYHDSEGTGRWTMYPWDQDQTWGLAGMMRTGDFFHDMPITFGMEGDVPPGLGQGQAAGRGRGPGFGFGFGFGGGPMWWRPGGYFSRPLLANPQFRSVFLARTREILETIYTPGSMGAMIDAMAARLEPEVELRAQVLGMDPKDALQDFALNLQGFRDHLSKRREFLLAQGEIQGAAKLPGVGLDAPPVRK